MDERRINEEKIRVAYSKKLKIHLRLKDKTWRNGFVKDINSEVFIFEDKVNGLQPIFFLEVLKVEPYFMESKND